MSRKEASDSCAPRALQLTTCRPGVRRIRYHLLHPEYIHQRISDLGGSYNLRIILVQCDADNHTAAMKELTKIALINGYTLMTCWT